MNLELFQSMSPYQAFLLSPEELRSGTFSHSRFQGCEIVCLLCKSGAKGTAYRDLFFILN